MSRLNRRDLLRSGIAAAGAMALPIGKKALAFSLARTETVTQGLEIKTGKPYDTITPDDLLAIDTLALPHIHIDSFGELDFHGLDNLKDLTFRSVFHYVPGLPAPVFANLSSLERLSLEMNQFEALADEVFLPLTNLKTLVLTYTSFENMPASLFQLPALESIVATGTSAELKQKLQEHYGAIVTG